MIKTVGVIGMGLMGEPMALNLKNKGFDITVYNRNPEKTRRLADAGATVAPSVAALAAKCDAVITMLSDDAAVRQVTLGDGGIATNAKPGTLVIDSSTVTPSLSQEIAAALSAKGVVFLDAPVTGSKPQAEEGKLFFLVGGPREAYDRAAPLLDAMGRKHVHLGPSGAGACAKICNNMCGLINLATFCEAMAIGRRFGVDPRQLFDVITNSGGKSTLADAKAPKILGEDFEPHFALALAAKDVGLAQQLGATVGVDAPIAGAVAKVYEQAKQAGEGSADVSALYRWYAKKS